MKLVFLGVLSLLLNATTHAEDDSKALQGTWLPASAELGGQPFPEQVTKSMRLTIEGDKYIVMVGPQKDEGTTKLDASKSPKTLEIRGTEGPNKGKTIPAIYKIEGNTLTVCYNLGGKDYPTEFVSKAGTQFFLVKYQRSKP